LAVYAIYDDNEVSKMMVLNLAYYTDPTTKQPTKMINVAPVWGRA